jgi:hypothetical protein
MGQEKASSAFYGKVKAQAFMKAMQLIELPD